jgi:hypothetical protein
MTCNGFLASACQDVALRSRDIAIRTGPVVVVTVRKIERLRR